MAQQILKSRNPIFNRSLYNGLKEAGAASADNRMTINGAVAKTFILGLLTLSTSVIGYLYAGKIVMYVGIIGAMIMLGLAKTYKEKAMFFGPGYALFKGLFVGTAAFNNARLVGYNEIIFQAALLTLAILFAMLALYKSGLVKVTEKFRSIVAMAVGGVMVYYLITMGLNVAGIKVPYIHEGGAVSIGIGAVILVIASLRLLVNFDNFRRGAKHKAAKHMEWYFATGLLFTIIWLYVESLRMLARIFKPNKKGGGNKNMANAQGQKQGKRQGNKQGGNKNNDPFK